jgi:nucleoredoxin
MRFAARCRELPRKLSGCFPRPEFARRKVAHFLLRKRGMRRGVVWAFLLFVFVAQAGQLPLTVKEMSLMLRSGYSSDALIQELAARHFADKLDADKEKTLTQAGASAELIAALKSGTYSLSPEQMASAQQQIADKTKRRAAEAEASRQFDSLYQSQIARQRADGPTRPPVTNANAVRELVKGDLVSFHNGALGHFDDEALEKKKLIALYFSAHWCAPCRKFTPTLVDYYNRVAPQHPEFEIIFVSSDKSQFGMDTYMREANMPWPAIDYQKLGGKDAIKKYAGDGIPCLVLVDQTGKVISDSFAGKEYVGPGKVLTDLDAIFAGATTPRVAGVH